MDPSATRQPREESTLLARLPVEIRLQVYDHFLPSKTFHLLMDDGGRAPWVSRCDYSGRMVDHFHAQKPHSYCYSSMALKAGLLNVPLTCRTIYCEMLPLFYEHSTFVFSQSQCLVRFLKQLPAQHRDRIPRILYYEDLYEHPSRENQGSLLTKINTRVWNDLCRYLHAAVGPHTTLYLDPDFSHCSKFCDDDDRFQDSKVWMRPLWKLSQAVHVRLIVPIGPNDVENMPTVAELTPAKIGEIWTEWLATRIKTFVDCNQIRGRNTLLSPGEVAEDSLDQFMEALRQWKAESTAHEMDDDGWTKYIDSRKLKTNPPFGELIEEERIKVARWVAERASLESW